MAILLVVESRQIMTITPTQIYRKYGALPLVYIVVNNIVPDFVYMVAKDQIHTKNNKN